MWQPFNVLTSLYPERALGCIKYFFIHLTLLRVDFIADIFL
jgi:hypothetical protein